MNKYMTFEKLKVGESFTIYGEEILVKIPRIEHGCDTYTCVCVQSSLYYESPIDRKLLFEKGKAYFIYNTTKVVQERFFASITV